MTNIPVERLTTGTTIYCRDVGFGSFATVTDIIDQPDDESFHLTLDFGGWMDSESLTVPYGGSVEFGGVGTPALKSIPAIQNQKAA